MSLFKGWRWGRALLIVSLALNIFFVSAIVFGAKRHWHGEHWGGWRKCPGGFEERLACRAAPELRAAIEKARQGLGPSGRREHMRAFRTFRRAIGAALRAEPFDRAALIAAADAFHDRHERHRARRLAFMLRLAEDLDKEGREELARLLERGRL